MLEGKKNFYGLVLATIEDIGPDLTFNKSVLPDDEAMLLSIQTFTLIGIGTGAPEGFHGPLPVPNRSDMQTIVYTFLTSGSDSSDVRIQKHGRHRALFLLFAKDSLHIDTSTRQALALYVENFLKARELTEGIFEEFKEVVENSALFYIDRISLYTKEIEKSRVRIRDLERDVKDLKYKLSLSKTQKNLPKVASADIPEKLAFLESLVEKDNILRGLLAVWVQKNKEMPVDHLSKSLGIHGGHLRFKLNKYIKSGLIELDKDGILRICTRK